LSCGWQGPEAGVRTAVILAVCRRVQADRRSAQPHSEVGPKGLVSQMDTLQYSLVRRLIPVRRPRQERHLRTCSARRTDVRGQNPGIDSGAPVAIGIRPRSDL
jgi:hypothetical protein